MFIKVKAKNKTTTTTAIKSKRGVKHRKLKYNNQKDKGEEKKSFEKMVLDKKNYFFKKFSKKDPKKLKISFFFLLTHTKFCLKINILPHCIFSSVAYEPKKISIKI